MTPTWLILGPVAGASIIALAACGGDSRGKQAADSTSGACPQTPLAITIDETSVESRIVTFAPPEGEQILVVKATARNNGDAAVAIRSGSFSATDGADRPVTYHLLDTGRNVRMTGTINAGKQLSGELDFGVPLTVTDAIIEYDDGCTKRRIGPSPTPTPLPPGAVFENDAQSGTAGAAASTPPATVTPTQ